MAFSIALRQSNDTLCDLDLNPDCLEYEVVDLVPDSWYYAYGAVNLSMTGLGLLIFILYPARAASDQKHKHPYPEWKTTSLLTLLMYVAADIFWLVNFIRDHQAGQIDTAFTTFVRFFKASPLVFLFLTFWASGSYGSQSQVDLGTDWAFTVNDDPHYSLVFNTCLWSGLLMTVLSFMAGSEVENDFYEKYISL